MCEGWDKGVARVEMIHLRRGTDESYSVWFAQVNELRILRQESVSRMDSLLRNGYAGKWIKFKICWIVMDGSTEVRYLNAGTLSYRSIILLADFHIDEVGISQTV